MNYEEGRGKLASAQLNKLKFAAKKKSRKTFKKVKIENNRMNYL